jgi:hypothetical protein
MNNPADLTTVLANYFESNRGLDPLDPTLRLKSNYGVSASLTGDRLRVALTFRCASVYCCQEFHCHARLYSGKRWDDLRTRLTNAGISAPSRMKLHATVVIQDGAVFFDFSRPDAARRGGYAFAPVEESRYEVTALEAPAD